MRVASTSQMPLASPMLRREAMPANDPTNVLVVSSCRPQADATKDSRETHLGCNSDTQRLDGPKAMAARHRRRLTSTRVFTRSFWHISDSDTALLIGQSDDLPAPHHHGAGAVAVGGFGGSAGINKEIVANAMRKATAASSPIIARRAVRLVTK